MSESWDERIDEFWESADDGRPADTLAALAELIREREDGDPAALYEWASVHDFLGREAEAIPLYREALAAGLSGDRRPQAIIQLASSLRNVGDPAAAIDLLEERASDAVTGAASQAFLALALHDAGRIDEALRVALRALAPTLPVYGRAVAAYADELVVDREDQPQASSLVAEGNLG
ncbi:tetratricopeptide repeat protein [Microbacterium oryzae]|uniref:tetratricopeptide repeat protein n=1 Tax=Microbacterium oryzae TaxID=743009 RepID=UPI0025B1F73A|nr:tetratricopeptide repeat protein [Microbacterium oryzae]MDN3311754.1 tetratricopeptide repeat protein [Microbacterium oryzae]